MTEMDNRAQESQQENAKEQEEVSISKADLKELQRYRQEAQKDLGVKKPGIISKSVGAISNSVTGDLKGAGSHLAHETNIGRERLIKGIKAIGSFLAKFTKPVEYLAGAVPDYFINRSKDPNLLIQDGKKLLKYGIPPVTVAALVAAPGITLAVGGVVTIGAAVGVLGYKVKKATDTVIERYRRGMATENAKHIEENNIVATQTSAIEIEKISSETLREHAAKRSDVINTKALKFAEKRSVAVAGDVELIKTNESSALNKLDKSLNQARAEIIQSYQIIDKTKAEFPELLASNESLTEQKNLRLAKSLVSRIGTNFNENLDLAEKILEQFDTDIDGSTGFQVGNYYKIATDVAEDITRLATKAIKDIVKKSQGDEELKSRVHKLKEVLDKINLEYQEQLEKGSLTVESLTYLLKDLTKATKN